MLQSESCMKYVNTSGALNLMFLNFQAHKENIPVVITKTSTEQEWIRSLLPIFLESVEVNNKAHTIMQECLM